MKIRKKLCRITCVCVSLLTGIAMYALSAKAEETLPTQPSSASEIKFDVSSKKSFDIGEDFDFDIQNVPTSCVIKISSSKALKLRIDKQKKVALSSTPQEFSAEEIYSKQTKKRGENEGGNISFAISSTKSTGKITLTLEVVQNNQSIAKQKYNLIVGKYENPFKKFIFNKRNITKVFKKRQYVEDGHGLSRKECKECWESKTGKPYRFELKRGYKLLGVYYNNPKWGGVGKKKWKNYRVMPKDFDSLSVRYKDKQGKKREVTIGFSSWITLGTTF